MRSDERTVTAKIETLPPDSSPRIASIDTLRGLIILLMVFVNDLGPAAPAWMLHIQPSDADGMTLADIVFPAFLFIVGISIPLAMQRAKRAGLHWRETLAHVVSRTTGLLIMGLIGVNADTAISLPGQWWSVLAFIAVLLAWCVVPRSPDPRRTWWLGLKIVGWIALAILVATYRSEPVATDVLFIGHFDNWTWLRTQWWGILGLIGWAYLVASLTFLALGRRREWLMAAMWLLLVVRLVFAGDGLFARMDSKPWLQPLKPALNAVEAMVQFVANYVDVGGALGSLAAVSVAGSLLGSILLGESGISHPRERVRWALSFAAIMFVGGLIFDSFLGVNKVSATPTWCLWSASITCALWVAVYVMMDVKGWSKWSWIARPAGANPLIAYLLHPILVGLLSGLGLAPYLLAYKNSTNPWIVIAGSIAMSLLICWTTGAIARTGFRNRI